MFSVLRNAWCQSDYRQSRRVPVLADGLGEGKSVHLRGASLQYSKIEKVSPLYPVQRLLGGVCRMWLHAPCQHLVSKDISIGFVVLDHQYALHPQLRLDLVQIIVFPFWIGPSFES